MVGNQGSPIFPLTFDIFPLTFATSLESQAEPQGMPCWRNSERERDRERWGGERERARQTEKGGLNKRSLVERGAPTRNLPPPSHAAKRPGACACGPTPPPLSPSPFVKRTPTPSSLFPSPFPPPLLSPRLSRTKGAKWTIRSTPEAPFPAAPLGNLSPFFLPPTHTPPPHNHRGKHQGRRGAPSW